MNNPQLLEVLGVVVKNLSRSGVQLQVAAFIAVVFLGRLIGRGLSAWVQVRMGAEPSKFIRVADRLVARCAAPLAVLALSWGLVLVLGRLGAFVGLLEHLMGLTVVYLVLRALLAALDSFVDPATMRVHQNRFWVPAFGVYALLDITSTYVGIHEVASVPLGSIFGGPLNVGSVSLASVGLYLWVSGTKVASDLVVRGAQHTEQVGLVRASATLIRSAAIVAGAIAALSALGVSSTTFAAVSGGLSVGVGFALQDVLKNFMGGIIVLFERSVRPGDWVEVGGTEGEVTQVSIRSSVVRTFDNQELIIPNQDWLSSTVRTFTRNDRTTRARVPIRVPVSEDPAEIQQWLVQLALANPRVLESPRTIAPYLGYEDGHHKFIVLAWVDEARDKAMVAGALRLEFWAALKARGIETRPPASAVELRWMDASHAIPSPPKETP